jgi:hypothetical protein
MPSLNQAGAMFAFEKPISVEQAVRTLSAARSMILDRGLRYHRSGLEVPVLVKAKNHAITRSIARRCTWLAQQFSAD